MGKYSQLFKRLRSQQGATAIIVGLMMVVFIGFAALAVDIGHLYVVRNELQNAADAGALAGARFLYNDDGTVNTGANQIAYNATTANKSEKVAVDVHWTGGNDGDVQRGHWCFATRTFTPNDSLVPVDLWNVSDEDLDANPNFINAVRVVSRRDTTPAASFFARIFGHANFYLSAEAVAYIGFAGNLAPYEVDEPIAICQNSILINNEYSCAIGRFINNSGQVDTSQTGEWSNFDQGDDSNSCSGTDSSSNNNIGEIIQPEKDVCGTGNLDTIKLDDFMSTTNGELQNSFDKLIECWKKAVGTDDDGKPYLAWNLTLPVINCDCSTEPPACGPTCRRVVGAVAVTVLWITDAGEDPLYKGVPLKMEDWTCSINPTTYADRILCWGEFVSKFKLKNADGIQAAPYAKKSIYFKPDCVPHEPTGDTGGKNFGIRAKIPKLVQ